MRRILFLLTVLTLVIPVTLLADEPTAEHRATQAELDAACEIARQENIAIGQAKEVERCVKEKEASDREACEELHKYYGEATGNRPALFYDLPECKAAHKFRSSY